ncbi:MAG: FtsX-like permease family protein, partial [Calditrichaeota bacterium]
MFKNYFKIAVRNLSRHRLYTLINISGLALGMGGSLLMFAYVLNELSYENFHHHRKQIYRVAVELGKGENSMLLAGAMPALGPALEKEEPEVLKAVRFQRSAKAALEYGGREFRESRFFFADPEVFDVFTFPLVAGDPHTALAAPFQLVVSETVAQKYFGDQPAVGKVLKYMGGYEFQVTGVMKDIPANTHLKCDFLASYSSLERIAKVEHPWNQFGQDYTYLLLQKGAAIPELRAKIASLLREHTNPAFAAMLSFRLQPLEEIHLHSKMMGELEPPGNLGYVYLFSSIAALVLLIACLNYMNLSTARSFHRVKEIGVRKVLGAGRLQLARQLLSESVLVTAVAMGFSLLIFELLFPSLARFLETELVMDLFRTSRFYLLLAGIMIFVGVVAGLYPALFLSRWRPVESLKNTLRPDSASAGFRRILVITQFAISVFLLAGTFVIERQLHFMKETDLGFEKQNVVLIPFQAGDEQVLQKYAALRQEFARNPQVVSVSGAYTVPGLHNKEQQSVRLKGAPRDEMVMMRAIGVDYDYVSTLGLRIVQGRNFSRAFSDDARHAILLNESAVKHLGLDEPIGSELLLPSGKFGRERTVHVVGVVKDFHVESLHESIEPLFLYINPERY